MSFEREIEGSVADLKSNDAMSSLKANSYWPKWHSPWWHMLLLHEMGETSRIPEVTICKHIESVNAMPVKTFPIAAGEVAADINPALDIPCHCQIANVYNVLSTWGVDVDAELPWIRPWFSRYQMADGGLNCDETAYRVTDECPSSMVGTIAAFEAMLMHAKRPLSSGEEAFIERAAQFLIERKLTFGSSSRHNRDETESARMWGQLTFPRFYHYDVLRGLDALTLWATMSGRKLSADVIEPALAYMEKSENGSVRVTRRIVENVRTRGQDAKGRWSDVRKPATSFALLEAVSSLGSVSPYLSRQWSQVQARLKALADLPPAAGEQEPHRG
jgi:hypothetical protein